MACEGIQNNPGVTYTAYVLGGSVIVGLYRLATAVYYIAQHFFNAEVYRLAYDEVKREYDQKAEEIRSKVRDTQTEVRQNERERRAEDRSAAQDTRQAREALRDAKGLDNVTAVFGFLGAKASEGATHASHFVGRKKDQVVVKATVAKASLQEQWNDLNEAIDLAPLATLETFEEAKMKAWKGEALRGVIELIPIIGGAIYTAYDLSHKDISVLGMQELAFAKEIDETFNFSLQKLRAYW